MRRDHGGWGGVAVVLAAALTVSCAVAVPRPVAPIAPVPESWQRAGADDTVTVESVADLSAWWTSLGDPLLPSLIERALAASPDIRSASARLRQARAARGLAGWDLLPTGTPSASASVTRTSNEAGAAETRELYSAGIDASWEVDVFGGTRRAVSAAQADLEAAEASLHDVQVSLSAEVALDYVELRSLQARLAIAKENLDRQAETLELTRWRAEAGLTSSLDVEQSRANLEQTRAQIPSLETNLAQTEHRLAVLLGLAPGALSPELAASAPIPSAPARVAVGIPADALRRRPDVRAAERRLAAEVARLGKARAARFPSLRLAGSIGVEALTPGGLLDGATQARSLLAGLTAPILNRGRIQRQIGIQDAVREQTLVAYEKTVLTALEEAENALVSLANSRRRQAALTSAVEAARNAALLAHHRYTAGLADFQTVLDTERSVLSVEDGLKSSEAEGIQALIRLYKALGGGWSSAPSDGRPAPRRQSEES